MPYLRYLSGRVTTCWKVIQKARAKVSAKRMMGPRSRVLSLVKPYTKVMISKIQPETDDKAFAVRAELSAARTIYKDSEILTVKVERADDSRTISRQCGSGTDVRDSHDDMRPYSPVS